MTPTPVRATPTSASPPGGFHRFRRGQQWNWDRRNVTPAAHTPVTPLVDEGAEIEQDLDDRIEGGEGENEDEEGGGGFEEEGVDGEEEEGGIEEVPMEIDALFDPAALGLKEIGNLASWTVSSCKPGCGVEALRDDDTTLFWQSDGPQPHHLNIHFSRLVSIVAIRIYLDFESDESYTPTRITILAGTGYHDLLPFSALSFEQPKGWIDVPLDHVGGGEDGKTLRAFLVQVRVVENHQNGKDTHVRGLKIYTRDDRARGTLGALDGLRDEVMEGKKAPATKGQTNGMERTWLLEPDWMGDPELR